MGKYVDYVISTGPLEFEKETELISKKFECKNKEFDNLRFAGVYIQKVGNCTKIHQESYIRRLSLLKNTGTYETFRSERARLTWIQHTRPEIASTVNILSQCTETNFREKIMLYNKTVLSIQQNTKCGLTMKKLDLPSLHTKVFSDSAFENSVDLSSQLSFIILLCDKFDSWNVVHFSSQKCRQIVRSILDAEVYAFADAFDASYNIKDLEHILGKTIGLKMFTDSKSLFDIIIKRSGTTENDY